MTLDEKIKALPGPVLVLGAGGFIGANIIRTLIAVRDDVYGTVTTNGDKWRLKGVDTKLPAMPRFGNSCTAPWVGSIEPKTVFNCIAYGAYSWQNDSDCIYDTNFNLTRRIANDLAKSDISAYIHAGSSSEYGTNCSGPTEDSPCYPNSHYAVSKFAATNYLQYMGSQGFPCAVLRLASVYGPWEHPDRLIPKVVEHGLRGEFPPFVDSSITRDFVYIDDVVEAFVDAALWTAHWKDVGNHGYVINIGSGKPTFISEVANKSRSIFNISTEIEPSYVMTERPWDHGKLWYLSIGKALSILDWVAKTSLEEGIHKTSKWKLSNYAVFNPDPQVQLIG